MYLNLNFSKLLILITTLSAFLGCSQATTQNNLDITGLWSWEYSNTEKPYLNKTFTLDLNQVGDELKGKYCAIAKNNTKMDCFYKDSTNNIFGKIKGDTIFIDFKGHYDIKAYGKGVLYKKGEFLVWKIIEQQGDIYAPNYAELKKGKLENRKKEIETSSNRSSSETSCLYSENCSCKENQSGKSIYEDSLQITCNFRDNSFAVVYKAIYEKETHLQKFLLKELPLKSKLHSDSETFSTDYKISTEKISIYISQENGGFEFILKDKGNKIIMEKHAFPG